MNILFLCTGNICRSPMAEGILNHLAAERGLDMHARSAGVSKWDAGHSGPTEFAVQAVKELYGVDISGHWSTYFEAQQADDIDLIICMERHHADAASRALPGQESSIMLLHEWAYGDKGRGVADPWSYPLKVYKECAGEIYDAIDAALENYKE